MCIITKKNRVLPGSFCRMGIDIVCSAEYCKTVLRLRMIAGNILAVPDLFL